MHLKTAYEMGVQLALEEAGLVKEANRFRKWLAEKTLRAVQPGFESIPASKSLVPVFKNKFPENVAAFERATGDPSGIQTIETIVNTLKKRYPDSPEKHLFEYLSPEKPGTISDVVSAHRKGIPFVHQTPGQMGGPGGLYSTKNKPNAVFNTAESLAKKKNFRELFPVEPRPLP